VIRRVLLVSAALIACAAGSAYAQTAPFPRLPATLLDANPPVARVQGEPPILQLVNRPCRTLPTDATRRRIVEIAVQEWAFFGFPIVDSTAFDDEAGPGGAPPRMAEPGAGGGGFRRPRVPPAEAIRIATSIAGYWAVTPQGSWIVERQNEAWRGAGGDGARWRDPWSAAFISWVMCEAGLGTDAQFQRAVAHHTYVDQAIRGRDGRAPQSAFTAYDAGEAPIEPGDLLCSARRPTYRTLAERRRQAGVGARMHCDIVVKVDAAADRLMAIGGNVRSRVAMKLLPAVAGVNGHLRMPPLAPGSRARSVFAHLKLKAPAIGPNLLDASPTMQALTCARSTPAVAYLAAANLVLPRIAAC
jgi:hypothetical protein